MAGRSRRSQPGIRRYPWISSPLIRPLTTLLLVLIVLSAVIGALTHLRASSGAVSDDWSMYLHDPGRSSASNDSNLSTSNASQLTQLWSFKTGGVIAASPTVVSGTVYVGSWDGYEYALDAATGALKWKTYLGTTTANSVCSPPKAGITSSAAVQNGVVYVGGGDAYWYALNATTGAVLWKVYTGDNSATGGHYNWSSPLLYNGYAYIGIASMGDCPLVQGQLLQVGLSSHQVVNTLNLVPNGQVGGGIWTSPTVDTATNTIYLSTGTEASSTQPLTMAMVSVDASSLAVKSVWKLPESAAVLDSDWSTTPTLFTDTSGRNLVVAANKNGIAYAFNRSNLSSGPVWTKQLAVGGQCPQCGNGSLSSGAFANGALYLAGGTTTINGTSYNGAVRELDPATGNFQWEHGAPGVIIAAIAFVNGLIIDGAGGTLEVLNASTGTPLYSKNIGGSIYAAPSISHGMIFTGNTNGSVFAFGLPSVTAVSLNGLNPNTGGVGTSVTLTGANFGSTQGASVVKFGNTTAAVTSWSNTSIVATVPSTLSPGPANVTVTVGGQTSNSQTFTVTASSTAYNNVGISDDSNPAAGNINGLGQSFSAQALQAVNITPGNPLVVNGVTFIWPKVASGMPDNYKAAGQTIPVTPVSGATTLAFLGVANSINVSAPAIITYSDGSTQTFSLSLTHWVKGTPAYGNTQVAKMPYFNSASGRQNKNVYLYYTSVALQAGKTIVSVTLPAKISGGQLHIFAISTK